MPPSDGFARRQFATSFRLSPPDFVRLRRYLVLSSCNYKGRRFQTSQRDLALLLQFAWEPSCRDLRSEDSMSWRVKVHSVILASAFFVSSGARGQSRTEELGPFPTALSLERFQQIALLSPGSNLGNARLLQEAQWRRAAVKSACRS